MHLALHDQTCLEPETQAFYRAGVDILTRAKIPFLIGGAYALTHYTGITRHTKDFDIFLRPADRDRALAAFTQAGYRAEPTFPHWLSKVHSRDNFLDIIHSSGNGLVRVDDAWFEHAVAGTVLGRTVLLCPVEEIIWSKGYIMERERYDGADIHHLLRACAPGLDWHRLIERFGADWRLLLVHLILFGHVYPAECALIPAEVINLLLSRLQQEEPLVGQEPLCQGTLLSRAQYLIDIHQWGYRDARLPPRGRMNPQDIAHWTAAIADEEPANKRK
jgi:hypothetical protein